ncbi:putative auxin-induced protein 6B-like [Capsicum annuum]|nr:putative auxin-induced protein 6B-like [Capsicum annuum]KAF3671465.1 putative auxin-induced protein 6B-like [Capsicum annuum]
MAILSAKKLIKMARGCQKFAAMQRRKISFTRNGSDADGCSTSSSAIVEKGHFVVYRIDQIRYAFPLTYLENEFTLFREVQHEMKKENAVLETFAMQITWKIEMDKMNIYRQSLIRIQNHPQKAKVVLNQITPEKYKQNIIPWRK